VERDGVSGDGGGGGVYGEHCCRDGSKISGTKIWSLRRAGGAS